MLILVSIQTIRDRDIHILVQNVDILHLNEAPMT